MALSTPDGSSPRPEQAAKDDGSSGASRVLVVDDDPTNRLVAVSMLRRLGLDADVAVNGREGVQRAEAQPYGVILMDIQMPVMDGVEAMKAIRALLSPERCPRIVAVTAYAVAGTRERMLAAGFDAFYTKPVTLADLDGAVRVAPRPPAALVARPMTDARHADDAQASRALLDQVNRHVVDLLGEEDPEFVADLVDTFSTTALQATADAREARQAQDIAAVAAAAHTLRGSASNVGLEDLTDLWTTVEVALRKGDHRALGDALDRALDQTARSADLLAAASVA